VKRKTTLIRVFDEDKKFIQSITGFSSDAERVNGICKISPFRIEKWLGEKPGKKRREFRFKI
jgi:hypothetical protein